MLVLFASESSNVIQVGTIESALFIIIAMLGAGVAWGSLRKSVEHIDKDLDDIKKDFKDFQREFTTVKTLVEAQAQSR